MVKLFNTEFQIHNLNEAEQRKLILNQIVKDLTDRSIVSTLPSQKILEQIIVEPITLLSCSSFIFQPLKPEHWEQLW